MKRHGLFHVHISCKMAESRESTEEVRRFVGDRARALLNAMVYFRNNSGRGRAGRTLPNLSIPHTSDQENGLEVGQSWPCGHAQALDELQPGWGGLSAGRGRGLSTPPPPQSVRRGRGLFLLTTSPTTPQRSVLRGRGFPSPFLHIMPPPQLEDCSPLRGARKPLSSILVLIPLPVFPWSFPIPTLLYLMWPFGPSPLWWPVSTKIYCFWLIAYHPHPPSLQSSNIYSLGLTTSLLYPLPSIRIWWLWWGLPNPWDYDADSTGTSSPIPQNPHILCF